MGIAGLASFLAGLASAVPSFGAEPVNPLKPIVVTNYVVVTNIVVITNYVVGTNVVLTFTTGDLSAGRTNSRPPDLSWVPPPDKFDWIQLKSGEWLKGTIKAMQKQELEFDSEELDLQTFDWQDVRQVRSSRILDVLFLNGQQVSGPVTITPKQVTVGSTNLLVFPRDQLHGFTPGGSKELNYWSGKASLGLTLRAGNSEQVDSTAQAHLQRRTPATRLSLDYIGNISRSDGVASANNHRVNAEFDLFLSRRFYLLLPAAEYYKDPFQNLAHRVTAGVGVGYDIVDRPKLEWSITTGPAYQQAWFASSQPGEPSQQGAAALVFGTHFDWDITKRLEFIFDYKGQYTGPEVGGTTHHTVATLSLELTRILDLDVSFIWDRIEHPKVGADGVQPKPDDFRLVVGLGVDF